MRIVACAFNVCIVINAGTLNNVDGSGLINESLAAV